MGFFTPTRGLRASHSLLAFWMAVIWRGSSASGHAAKRMGRAAGGPFLVFGWFFLLVLGLMCCFFGHWFWLIGWSVLFCEPNRGLFRLFLFWSVGLLVTFSTFVFSVEKRCCLTFYVSYLFVGFVWIVVFSLICWFLVCLALFPFAVSFLLQCILFFVFCSYCVRWWWWCIVRAVYQLLYTYLISCCMHICGLFGPFKNFCHLPFFCLRLFLLLPCRVCWFLHKLYQVVWREEGGCRAFHSLTEKARKWCPWHTVQTGCSRGISAFYSHKFNWRQFFQRVYADAGSLPAHIYACLKMEIQLVFHF